MTPTRAFLLLTGIVTLLALGGCTLDFAEPRAFACPVTAIDDFRNVSAVLEKRCGSLDCHGNLARPLRIMGSNGLRLYTPEEFDDPSLAEDAGMIPGGLTGTTDLELEQNRESICGIEPERTEQVVFGELEPEELMVIRKPTLRERHKGSQVFLKGGAGEACVASWLTGNVIVADCLEALQAP
ncbi:MAG: hypothetical protein R3B72_36570 [Polyangiaceae bacterium]